MDYHPSSTIFIDNILAQRQGTTKWIVLIVCVWLCKEICHFRNSLCSIPFIKVRTFIKASRDISFRHIHNRGKYDDEYSQCSHFYYYENIHTI